MSNFSIIQLIRALSTLGASPLGGNATPKTNNTPTPEGNENGVNNAPTSPLNLADFLGGNQPSSTPTPSGQSPTSQGEKPTPNFPDVQPTAATAYEVFLTHHDNAVERIKNGKK